MFSYIANWLCSPSPSKDETMALTSAKVGMEVNPFIEVKVISHESSPYEETVNVALQKLQEYIEIQTVAVAYRSNEVHYKLLEGALENCKAYAINFFCFHLLKDSTIQNDQKKWEELFAKIEETMKKAMGEIARSSDAIAIGYLVQAGMPSWMTQYLGFPKPIYFDDSQTISSDYLLRLMKLVPESLPNLMQLQKDNLEMFRITFLKCEVSLEMKIFIEEQIVKFKLRNFIYKNDNFSQENIEKKLGKFYKLCH